MIMKKPEENKEKEADTRKTAASNAEKETAPEYNTDFMREEIRQRPVNKKRLLRRTIMTACLAVLFGVIACAVFIFLEPVINEAINPTEKPAPVTFTEGTTEEEMNPEDMIADDSQIQEQAAEEKAESSVETIKREVLEELEKELAGRQVISSNGSTADEDAEAGNEENSGSSGNNGVGSPAVTESSLLYESLAETLRKTAEEAQKSLVTVTGITQDYDWAGDAFDDSDSASGLLIAEKGTDLLILANNDNYDKAGKIRVTFHDGQQADARLVSTDPVTGLAVLSVSESRLSGLLEDNDRIEVCSLGSSARSDLPGSAVIAVGSPAGTQGSVNYGIITNAGLALDVADSSFTQITTDIYGSTQATGVLVNMDGEVIGWIDMGNNRSDSPNMISAVGITGIKPLIEKMSNEMQAGFLGVHCTDVPEEISREEGIPAGAYVIRTDMDSPAMEAGIQSGDVITDVSGSRISSSDVLTSILGQSRASRQLNITVMRATQDVYHQVNLSVTLSERLSFPDEK